VLGIFAFCVPCGDIDGHEGERILSMMHAEQRGKRKTSESPYSRCALSTPSDEE
jgi:hypothetical protein